MKWWLVVFFGALGCSRCGGAGVGDAGAPEAVVAKEPRRFSTDLRTVVLTIFPEYRGTNLRSAVTRLTRTYRAKPDWLTEARAVFSQNRVTETGADGGLSGALDQFQFSSSPLPDGRVKAVIELPISGDTIGQLYTNPASLSSLQLGLYLPRSVPIERDVFEFDLIYDGVTERRTAFLTRQVVELMLGNMQWKPAPFPDGWEPNLPDGGYGPVPAQFELTLTGVVDGAQVTVKRDGAHVFITYRLLAFEP